MQQNPSLGNFSGDKHTYISAEVLWIRLRGYTSRNISNDNDATDVNDFLDSFYVLDGLNDCGFHES